HANNAVRAEMARCEADKSLSKQERSDAAVRAWVKEAIELGGEAIWGRPNIAVPEEAKDQLQSPYILKVMAYHLGAIQGSVWVANDDEKVLPEGALALAACAVEHAFEWYSDGQGRGIPQPSFSKDDAGKDTVKWHVTAVDALLEKPHRFECLLERARALVTVPAPPPMHTSANRHAGKGSVMNRRYIRERSSSPPAAC
ncbi:hypothetical protein L227DRAFT_513161, partial [Lentinus tigrinus ALCF2SS1-6]